MQDSLNKVLAGVRRHSPLLTFVELGLTPEEIKKSIIDLLSPYFTNHSILQKWAVEVLPPEAVSVGKILADPWAEQMLVTVLSEYRASLLSNEEDCFTSSATWELIFNMEYQNIGADFISKLKRRNYLWRNSNTRCLETLACWSKRRCNRF